jgi:hypothetical protein
MPDMTNDDPEYVRDLERARDSMEIEIRCIEAENAELRATIYSYQEAQNPTFMGEPLISKQEIPTSRHKSAMPAEARQDYAPASTSPEAEAVALRSLITRRFADFTLYELDVVMGTLDYVAAKRARHAHEEE